ncbi:MAG: hypothetical protein H7Y30_14135 [Pyrinomonadaceae bacterium]|nr:hypothetical protein [Pyrinomonadaceae bacterium]
MGNDNARHCLSLRSRRQRFDTAEYLSPATQALVLLDAECPHAGAWGYTLPPANAGW